MLLLKPSSPVPAAHKTRAVFSVLGQINTGARSNDVLDIEALVKGEEIVAVPGRYRF